MAKKKTAREKILEKAIKNSDYEIPQEDSFQFVPIRFKRLGHALGGGLARGGLYEISGFNDAGKTSLGISLAADVQKWLRENDPDYDYTDFLNFEHVLDEKWARILGLDTTRGPFERHEPDNLEDCLDILIELVSEGQCGVFVIDSIAAALAKTEVENDMSDYNVGIQAKRWNQAFKKLLVPMRKHGTIGICVNQRRYKIGGGPTKGWIKPSRTVGGQALKYYSWGRMKLYSNKLYDSDIEGLDVTINLFKHKTSPRPGGKFKYKLYRGIGFDVMREYISLATELDIINQSGSWYSIEGVEDSIQGIDNLVEYLKGNQEKLEEILEKVEKGF